MTTTENARISKERAEIQSEVNDSNLILANAYKSAYELWSGEENKASHEFEEKRQVRIQEAVNLRIEVDERFQPVVDEFLKQLN